MKGPGLRNDLEIRRTFRCTRCGRTVLKLGDVVSLTCSCTEPPVWMLIQPDPQKRQFKFDKIEIPLSEADLVIRERPRRMPPPPPEGAVENPNDRRNARPKRPKPERRSFESFQEDLAAKVESEANANSGQVTEITRVEVTEIVISESAAGHPAADLSADSPATRPAENSRAENPPPSNSADEFGEGL